MGEIRVSAEVILKQWLEFIGGPTYLVVGVVVLLIGVGILVYERKKSIPIRPGYFLGIVLESSIYAVIVAFLVSNIVQSILLYAQSADSGMNAVPTVWMQIALSIGAGIYEELLFRVILVGGLYWVLQKILKLKKPAYIVAAVVGALVFSAVHYLGPLGDVVTMQSFLFRFIFGLALNVLFLVRGFGVAAWTHSLYDIMIVTRLLG